MKQVTVVRWALVVTALLWMSATAWCYTREDITKAAQQHDNTLLKKITDDKSVPVELRLYALGSLPDEVRVTYLDSDLVADQPTEKLRLFMLAARHFDLATARYAEAFQLLADIAPENNWYVYYHTLQRSYVNRLGAEGKWGEALAESKRLIGLTPPDRNFPKSALETINLIIKGESYARTQNVTASVQAMQAFMSDAQNGTSKSSWFDVPYPGETSNTAVISPLEKSKDTKLRIWALLYAGKYELARQEADKLYAEATTTYKIKTAMMLIAQCVNGKAQHVDAANDLLAPSH